MESQDGSAPVALAPSAVPTERFHVIPRALPVDLIQEIVAGYGAGARRLREAGLDGVEIVASHGYLPAQFLNPRMNLPGRRLRGQRRAPAPVPARDDRGSAGRGRGRLRRGDADLRSTSVPTTG